jgi:hypothetical protein
LPPDKSGLKHEHGKLITVGRCLFAWELENPRMIERFEVKGKLRLFEVDDSLIKFL